jgi:hypothetical protein
MSAVIKVDPQPEKRRQDIDLNPERCVWTHDGEGQVFTYADFGPEEIRFKTLQDPTEIYRGNDKLRTNADEGWNASGEMKHVARVPLALWLEWERLGITADHKALMAALKKHQQCLVTNRRL